MNTLSHCSLRIAAQHGLAKLLIFLFVVYSPTQAETIICTQNLTNYGTVKIVQKRTKKTKLDLAEQKIALIERFREAKCDIIAAQEVLAKNEKEARKVLASLANALGNFGYETAHANDHQSKLGIIFNKDRFKSQFVRSYSRKELPKFSKYEKNRRFSRGPLRVDLVRKKDNRTFSIFNFHFKSKAIYGGYDSSGYKFELDRIQMAHGLKEIITEAKRYKKNIFIALGDRNSLPESASAKVLSGQLEFDFFKRDLCDLLDNGTPVCPEHLNYKAQLRTLFQQAEKQLIDDILIDKSSLSLVKGAGYILEERPYTDHPLLWIELSN